jgi:hypothetical protein
MASANEIMAWVDRLLHCYFQGPILWTGTGIEAFPLVKISPREPDWMTTVFRSPLAIDQVILSEDLQQVGRFSTEERSYDFVYM